MNAGSSNDEDSNQQFVLVGAVFGIGDAPKAIFGFRCAPPTAVMPGQEKPSLQSIYIGSMCVVHEDLMDGLYGDVRSPVNTETGEVEVAQESIEMAVEEFFDMHR
ncbi:hypothetical protein MKZ38_000804 [Zalerion maritima]|uniref:Uncharacterized protein n=1 Tax=Zalerion maritima TaxID=339359 RepID=A0AAD5RSF9_9PEZI|nr:hypothetical protein MKZ38_000804 [Zalerion maritima]